MSKRLCVVCLENTAMHNLFLCVKCYIDSPGYSLTPGLYVEWAARRARLFERRRSRKRAGR